MIARRKLVVPLIMLALFVGAFGPTTGTVGQACQTLVKMPARLLRMVLTPGSSAFTFVTTTFRDTSDADLKVSDLMQLHEQVWRDGTLLKLYYDNQRLRRENAALQHINERFGDSDVTLPMVAVTARQFESAGHQFTLGHGTRHGLHEGQVVVVGPNLIGQIIDAGRSSATVRLVSSPGTVINSIVAPANWSKTGLKKSQLETRQFEAGSDGTLTALVPKDAPVALGQIAFLRDEDWPAEAQGCAIGQVIKIEPVDEHPLRVRVTLEPMRPYQFIDKVVVIVLKPLEDTP